MASRTKAELETLVRQQREALANAQHALAEAQEALGECTAQRNRAIDKLRDCKPPRLRILELPSEWVSRDSDKTRTPFVLVIDRAPNDVVNLDTVDEQAENIGARGVLAFREAIQLGEDWEQVDAERTHRGLFGDGIIDAEILPGGDDE